MTGPIAERDWQFLDNFVDVFPFRLEGPGNVSGFDGDKFGECISRPVPLGKRTWAFADESSRDRFAKELKKRERLAQVDRSPKGQDPAEGLDRNDESAVGETDAPKG